MAEKRELAFGNRSHSRAESGKLDDGKIIEDMANESPTTGIMLSLFAHCMEVGSNAFHTGPTVQFVFGLGQTFVHRRGRTIRGGSIQANTIGCGGLTSTASKDIQSWSTRRHKGTSITSGSPEGTHSLEGETKFPNCVHVCINNKGEEMQPMSLAV